MYKEAWREGEGKLKHRIHNGHDVKPNISATGVSEIGEGK